MVNNENKGILYCTQNYCDENENDHLNCILVKMKKQGDACIVRNNDIIMRCIFKDNILIHAVRIGNGKHSSFLTGEDIAYDAAEMKREFSSAHEEGEFYYYSMALITRLLYDPSIEKRKEAAFVDFKPQGQGHIYFSPPFNNLILSLTWDKGVMTGEGYLYDIVSNRLMEKILFDDDSVSLVEIVLPNQYTQGDLRIREGRIWQGDLLYGVVTGNGALVNSQGIKLYEGMMLDGMKEGAGVEYSFSGDSYKRSYCGMWCSDKRHGAGTCYASDGSVEQEGIWQAGKIGEKKAVVSGIEPATFSSSLQFLYIGDEACSDVVDMTLSHFVLLTRLRIGSRACPRVTHMECRHLHHLTSIVIGDDSFTQSPQLQEDASPFVFDVTDCTSLLQLAIGRTSFPYFQLRTDQLPSLQHFSAGLHVDVKKVMEEDQVTGICSDAPAAQERRRNAFADSSFALRNAKSLKTFLVGDGSFSKAMQLVLQAPQLETLSLGVEAFQAVSNPVIDSPLNCLTTVHVADRSLQELAVWTHAAPLRSLRIGKYCFSMIKEVPFSGIPQIAPIMCSARVAGRGVRRRLRVRLADALRAVGSGFARGGECGDGRVFQRAGGGADETPAVEARGVRQRQFRARAQLRVCGRAVVGECCDRRQVFREGGNVCGGEGAVAEVAGDPLGRVYAVRGAAALPPGSHRDHFDRRLRIPFHRNPSGGIVAETEEVVLRRRLLLRFGEGGLRIGAEMEE